jgi:DNA-binding NarL/FixJ family response regulator
LTKREAEVLFWTPRAKTYDAIATLCNISLRTVHKHVERICVKLCVETRTAAMIKALEIE